MHKVVLQIEALHKAQDIWGDAMVCAMHSENFWWLERYEGALNKAESIKPKPKSMPFDNSTVVLGQKTVES